MSQFSLEDILPEIPRSHEKEKIKYRFSIILDILGKDYFSNIKDYYIKWDTEGRRPLDLNNKVEQELALFPSIYDLYILLSHLVIKFHDDKEYLADLNFEIDKFFPLNSFMNIKRPIDLEQFIQFVDFRFDQIRDTVRAKLAYFELLALITESEYIVGILVWYSRFYLKSHLSTKMFVRNEKLFSMTKNKVPLQLQNEKLFGMYFFCIIYNFFNGNIDKINDDALRRYVKKLFDENPYTSGDLTVHVDNILEGRKIISSCDSFKKIRQKFIRLSNSDYENFKVISDDLGIISYELILFFTEIDKMNMLRRINFENVFDHMTAYISQNYDNDLKFLTRKKN